MSSPDNQILEADFDLGFTYTRSPGLIIGKFLAALQQKRLYGIRRSNGEILFPPTEYDPISAASLDQFVAVEGTGTVVSWSWVSQPRAHHDVEAPFAFALIQLDGADTPFLHRLFCDSAEQISAGMRVSIQWAKETRGAITDIHGFVPLANDKA